MADIPRTTPIICMVGTDHTLAPVEARSVFVLPAERRTEELERIKNTLGASGVALVTTCNRTELWASFYGNDAPIRSVDHKGTPRADDPLLQALCYAHCLDPSEHTSFFAARDNEAAVEHLFQTACGLRSAIVAEDQVISQIKQAIAYSRDHGLADSCLEVLFRQAVTSAKQVKTDVRFTRAYATAVEAAMDILKERGIDLSKATCMVIGNGEYGRLAASTLAQRDAHVMVTVRQYTHGYVAIPAGCDPIPYAERYEHLAACDVVMSATTSPHCTLTTNMVERYGNKQGMIIFDLAIPNDVELGIRNLPNCEVFDIDSFSTQVGSENTQAVAQAKELLDQGTREFWGWVARRDQIDESGSGNTFFPLFVDLSDKRVVFVGGGTIALRRIRTILSFVKELVVVAPDVSPEIAELAKSEALIWQQQPYNPSCLEEADIVFACTNDHDLNTEIAHQARINNQLVNVCSDRTQCDFYFPGVAQHDQVVVGVSAGGKNHRQVRQLRQRIQQLLEEEDI